MSAVRRSVTTARIGALAVVDRTLPFWPAAWIERLQRRRVRAVVRHAYATVPFYRRAMDERGLTPADLRTADDLAKLPLIDSTIVRTSVDQFISSRYDPRACHAFHTSGSLYHAQKVIYWDDAALVRRLAYEERDRAVLGRLVGRGWGQRQLFILPTGTASLQRRRLWDARTVTPRGLAERRVIAPDLSVEAMVAELDAFRPDVVFSYGSTAEIFFRSLKERGLRPALPRVWAYNSDLLSPDSRQMIEQEFGCRVYSTYPAIETGRIGFECERGRGFHLNIDLCPVRLVDEAGRPVAPGEPGEIVVSPLINRAMVLLNYRLGDRGVLDAAPCGCGRTLPLLAALDGRVTDVIMLADGRLVSELVVRKRMGEELRRVLQSQIVQEAAGRITWRLVPFAGVDREALGRAVAAKARAVLDGQFEVTIEFVDAIPPTARGKHLQVVQGAERHGE